ncbi:hypothetical protein GGI24_001761, partial [Coemansia furcata]
KIARVLTDRSKLQRSISARDKAGQTKLHRACNAGDLELTISLINQGAEVNLKDNAGWTPLHEAALEGHNAVVVALLRRGADFSARGFGGDTPLHDACANGHVDVARSLLVVGADPLARNLKHITPEDMAKEEEQDEVLQIIDAHRRGLLRAPQRIAHVDSGLSGKSEKNGKGKRPASVPVAGPVRSDDGGSSERLPKSRPRPTQPSPARSKDGHRERRPASALSNDSDDQGAGDTSAHKKELVSLRRLREEAEKPTVNYYFSSSSSKMSRDERKLQVLMGTIERMEKRKPREKERRQASTEPDTDVVSGKAAVVGIVDDDGTRAVTKEEEDDVVKTAASRHHHHHHHPVPGPLSNSLSPKRRRGRPPKKRVIDDDDDDKESPPMAPTIVAPVPVRHAAKRARRDTNATADSVPTVITIDGTSTPRHVPISPTPDEPAQVAIPTVEIKTEPMFIASPIPVSGSATIGRSGSKHASRHGLPGAASTHRDKQSKHHRVAEGGRTIVESTVPQRAEAMTPSSIAAQAIRYLPLYTIQLHDDPPTSKPNYYVVDLQVRLLLSMPVDTASTTTGSNRSDGNPLFAAYPHLCRRRISEVQKERLWEPLAGMFVSNMQFIHESTTPTATTPSNADFEAATPATQPRKSAERKPRTATGSSRPPATASSAKADNELVSQFTLHEKKKFVGLGLYFVKLDEVVEIIRRDFPQISKQLITISLDLSTIDIAAAAAPPLRPLSDVIDGDGPAPQCPEWTGPQPMLPLRYALKLHYRDRQAFIKGTGGSGTEGKP